MRFLYIVDKGRLVVYRHDACFKIKVETIIILWLQIISINWSLITIQVSQLIFSFCCMRFFYVI